MSSLIDDIVDSAVQLAEGKGVPEFPMSQLSPSVKLWFQGGHPVNLAVVQGEKELMDWPITPTIRVEIKGESVTVLSPVTTPEK